MGFQQGLSGLNSASKFLDVVGNNVANANTVGYKGARAEFADVYANTLASTNVQVGIGGRTSAVAQQFAQGNITSTDNPLDIAIQGNGFFRMIDPAGSFSYARNGQFQLDREGYIVNNNQKLAGYAANSDGQLITGATPQAIQIQTSNIGAQATGGSALSDAGLTLGMNLDARKPIINRGTSTVSVTGARLANAAGTSPVNYTTRVTDSTGQFHTLDVRLTRAAPQTWTVETQLDGAGGFSQTATPLTFSTPGGQITSGGTQAVSYNLSSPAPAYGTTPMNFNLNFAGALEVAAAAEAPGTVTVNDTAALNTTVQISSSNLDPADPVTTPHTYSGSYLDGNGVSHTIDITLTKAATNTWVPTIDIDGAAFPIVPTPASIVFNTNGQMVAGSPIAITGAPGAVNFSVNLQGVTQQTGAFTAGTVQTRSTPPVVATDPSSYTHSTSATVYDSQGVGHTMTFYFAKVGVNAWEVQTSFDGATPVTQPGYVTFDAAGNMNGGTEFAYTSPIPSPSGAQTPLAFNTYFTGTTQFGNQFGVNELSQDGYADGNITGLSIGKDGIILGRYSNGQNRTIGQITLYNFANPQGLQPLGDNRWAESYASNQARLGTPGTSDFGTLQSGAVEDSNIDLTKELVDMITAQRSYQANAQTIKTQDQILQTLVNLR
ncbi:flagellar hook protein FlgE [Chitinimonas arctica]|uniref:Flagellar hook protein FlgE n=1 Tax=Chitinimonas arctica TaxID=2594795 RepID=A0A516SL17_9NEIS|nr:flagellar hook protein FlgE [Chitinimonas arctica]QDQ28846.1 flagellar hook protein FlgE [Chitinimonas arctica]